MEQLITKWELEENINACCCSFKFKLYYNSLEFQIKFQSFKLSLCGTKNKARKLLPQRAVPR